MKGIFSYDNPVMRFIGKFWDVLVLNILWLICSIPVFTIGASTTAVYYVTLKLARDDDGYTIRSFFHSFKQNFRQATIIWLILLATGIILIADVWFVLTANVVPAGTMRVLATALFLGLLIVWFAVLTYVFPVLARFYGTVRQTITNAFLLSVRYILYTIAMIILDALIVILTITSLPVLTMLGVALIAFVNSFLLEIVFKKVIPKEERDVQDMRPLFADEPEGSEEPIYHMFVRNSDDSTGTPADGMAETSGETVAATEAAGAAEEAAGSTADPEEAAGAAEEAAGGAADPEGAAGVPEEAAGGSSEAAGFEPEITKTEN